MERIVLEIWYLRKFTTMKLLPQSHCFSCQTERRNDGVVVEGQDVTTIMQLEYGLALDGRQGSIGHSLYLSHKVF
jgi:hypothetical protein